LPSINSRIPRAAPSCIKPSLSTFLLRRLPLLWADSGVRRETGKE